MGGTHFLSILYGAEKRVIYQCEDALNFKFQIRVCPNVFQKIPRHSRGKLNLHLEWGGGEV